MANGTAVGGPNVPQTEANPAGGMVPFRRATTGRTSRLPSVGPRDLTASQQQIQTVVDGSGYIYAIDIDVSVDSNNNNADVAYEEDAPWNALAAVVFGDVNGELVNLDGYSLFLANLYGGWTRVPQDQSSDTSIYQLVTGTAATGGDLRFHLYVPVALNRRSLLGLVANQDRAQKYTLRTDLAAQAVIYSTAPNGASEPSATINLTYDNYAVPAAQNANGAAQQQVPPKFGVLHFLTQSVNPSVPAGSSTVNHYLPRLGNTIRLLILVFRENGSRASAEANMPTQLSFKLGDTPLFTETVAYRRRLMFDRYGFDAPDGVLVYDFITDILNVAGAEMGEDYAFTNGLVNAQFEIAYPSGFGSTNNSLTIITDDLQIPANVDIYAPDA